MSFGNLTQLLCKTCGVIFYCFVHEDGRLITWMQTKDTESALEVILTNMTLCSRHKDDFGEDKLKDGPQ